MNDHSLPGKDVLVTEGLFCEVDGEHHLAASKCRDCGNLTFPQQASCSRCGSRQVEQEPLPREGELWTWTVQTFPPKPPFKGGGDDFAPFGVGYVDLRGRLRVESRLTETDPAKLRIGMAMRMTLVPVPGDPTRLTYAFAPKGTSDE